MKSKSDILDLLAAICFMGCGVLGTIVITFAVIVHSKILVSIAMGMLLFSFASWIILTIAWFIIVPAEWQKKGMSNKEIGKVIINSFMNYP